jgi:hypothetical protein
MIMENKPHINHITIHCHLFSSLSVSLQHNIDVVLSASSNRHAAKLHTTYGMERGMAANCSSTFNCK